jgi:predicted Kef-type K+ transport protein
MFTLGLEFSASDMKKVKHVSIPTALFDTTMMIWLGYTVGTRVLGWNGV